MYRINFSESISLALASLAKAFCLSDSLSCPPKCCCGCWSSIDDPSQLVLGSLGVLLIIRLFCPLDLKILNGLS